MLMHGGLSRSGFAKSRKWKQIGADPERSGREEMRSSQLRKLAQTASRDLDIKYVRMLGRLSKARKIEQTETGRLQSARVFHHEPLTSLSRT